MNWREGFRRLALCVTAAYWMTALLITAAIWRNAMWTYLPGANPPQDYGRYVWDWSNVAHATGKAVEAFGTAVAGYLTLWLVYRGANWVVLGFLTPKPPSPTP